MGGETIVDGGLSVVLIGIKPCKTREYHMSLLVMGAGIWMEAILVRGTIGRKPRIVINGKLWGRHDQGKGRIGRLRQGHASECRNGTRGVK